MPVTCEFCGIFVKRRKALVPYTPDEVSHMQDIAMVCKQCYDEHMRRCVGVLGEEKGAVCRRMYQEYTAAHQYAANEWERMQKRKATALARVAATQPYLPRPSVSLWPSVPSTAPMLWPKVPSTTPR